MTGPRHGGDLIAETLKAAGVSHLFTLSGGHIAPIYDGCVRQGIRIVDFRHEQAANIACRVGARHIRRRAGCNRPRSLHRGQP